MRWVLPPVSACLWFIYLPDLTDAQWVFIKAALEAIASGHPHSDIDALVPWAFA